MYDVFLWSYLFVCKDKDKKSGDQVLSLLEKLKYSNCRIPGHLKLYPLKTRICATQFVHRLSFFRLFLDTLHWYTVMWLHSYVT